MSEANERPFLFVGSSPGIAGGACDDSNPASAMPGGLVFWKQSKENINPYF